MSEFAGSQPTASTACACACAEPMQINSSLPLSVCVVQDWLSVHLLLRSNHGQGFIIDFLTNYVLFSFMIPLSLYVTIEFVKVGQAQFMECDELMTWKDPYRRDAVRLHTSSHAILQSLITNH